MKERKKYLTRVSAMGRLTTSLKINTEISNSIKSRLITYPIGAFCTFFNFYEIHRYFDSEHFNIALQFWMLIGIIPVFEYPLGIQILNAFAIWGNNSKSWQKLGTSMRSYLILGLPLTALSAGLVFFLPISPISEHPQLSSSELKGLISIFLIAMYFSGLSQIIIRVYTGLRKVVLIQYLQLAGMVASSLTLAIVVFLHGSFTLLITTLLITTVSPGFFGLLLYNRSIQRKLYADVSTFAKTINLSALRKQKELGTSKKMTTVYFLIAAFYTITIMFPRVFANFEPAHNQTAYLLVLTSVNVLNSIISSVAPSFWVDGLQLKLTPKIFYDRFKFMLGLVIISLPIYFAITFIIFAAYLNLPTFKENVSAILLGYAILVSYSLHIVSSNLLSKGEFQRRLLNMGVFQVLATSVALALGAFRESINVGLGTIFLVHLIFATIPTTYLVTKSTHRKLV